MPDTNTSEIIENKRLNTPPADSVTPDYKLGPGDIIDIRVWRLPNLSVRLPIRPDGRFSTPLVEDMQASGKTPTQLAADLEIELSKYVQEPIVTVIVSQVAERNKQQVRVLGQVVNPKSVPYHSNMTVLDVMIEVGGLGEFAAGNRAVLVRTVSGRKYSYALRLDDLLEKGDLEADKPVLPGDTIIIPEGWL